MIWVHPALLQLHEGHLSLGGGQLQNLEWQSDERQRQKGLCEVHLQMEMTGLLMTGLHCVIVESNGWIGVPAIV